MYIVCLGLLGSRRIALTYWLAGVFPGLLFWHVVRASVACHARCVIVVHSHGTAVAGDFGAATIATRYLDGNQPFARAKPLGPPVLEAVDDIFPLSAASIGTPFPYNPRYYVMGHDRCILCVLVLSASASPGESPLASPAHYAGRAGDSSPTSAAAAMAALHALAGKGVNAMFAAPFSQQYNEAVTLAVTGGHAGAGFGNGGPGGVCAHVRIYLCLCVHVRVYVHVYVIVYVHVHVHVHVHVYVVFVFVPCNCVVLLAWSWW